MFYNGFENRGYGPNIGENYPFQFGFSPGATNTETPINAATFPSLAGTACANFFAFESGFTCTPLDPALVGAAGLGFHSIQYNYKTPYTQGWNMTFQYEMSPNTTVTMAYVGNTTRHIEVFPGTNNVNAITPVSGAVSAVVPCPTTVRARIQLRRNGRIELLQQSPDLGGKALFARSDFPRDLHSGEGPE